MFPAAGSRRSPSPSISTAAAPRTATASFSYAGGGDNRRFECLKTALRRQDWVVRTKAPFAGAGHVPANLGRFTHRTAIANHRGERTALAPRK